jgi:hypothetical protein
VLTLYRAWRTGVVRLFFAGLKILQFGVHGVATHALDASAQGGFECEPQVFEQNALKSVKPRCSRREAKG